MKLQEFSELLLKDANDAKNFISFLIGNFNRLDDDIAHAIISVYKNLPESYKTDKKIYIPVIHKYFVSFPIDKNNKDVFEEYLPLFRSTQIDEIKSLNEDTDYEFEKVEYKNSLEFIKSLVLNKYDYTNKTHQLAIDFLEQNENIVTELINKNRKTFVNNMIKYNVFKDLAKYEPIFLEKFCIKHGFNYAEIMRDYFFSNAFRDGTFYSITTFNVDKITETLALKVNDDDFWKVNATFLNPVGDGSKEKHAKLLEFWVEAIGSKKTDLALVIMNNYHFDLIEQIKKVLDFQQQYKKNIINNLQYDKIDKVGNIPVIDILENEDPIDIYSESTINKIALSLTDGSYKNFHQWINRNDHIDSYHNSNLIKEYINEMNKFKLIVNKINERNLLEKELPKKDVQKPINKI